MRIVGEILLAVLNSLWQAALVAAVVWLVLRLLRRGFPRSSAFQQINAATRYAIWWAVLGVTLALPAAPGMIAWWHARARPALEASPRPAAPRSSIAPLIEEQPLIVTLREERAARWPAWVLGAWAALCLYRLTQIGRSYVYLRGVKRRAVASQTALPPIARPARLLLSSDIASPMAVGFLHPAVILPESLPGELAQPEMEHVLLHEAAHIARRDDWTNLLARLLGAALALHPVAWWILRQIEREREIACDDWVVARTGSARPYAQSLARMSELRWSKKGAAHGPNQGEALASGIFGGGSRLGERIEMLLARGRDFSAQTSGSRVTASAALLLGCAIAGALAPRWIAFAQEKASFAVASVKPANPKFYEVDLRSLPGGVLRATNIPLRSYVLAAYDLYSDQLSGGPGWFGSDLFDIDAKAPDDFSQDPDRALLGGRNGLPKRMGLMLQTLLEDRFKLKSHWETKERTMYALVVAKGGPKLQEVKPNDPGERCCWTFNSGQITARFRSMPWLAEALRNNIGAPVQDQTGLKGVYDFKLEWQNERDPDAKAGPSSVFTAVQDELGLKLEPQKGPVEILVVDHVEKPDAN